MVRQGDGLGLLHVGVAGHDGVQVVLGDVEDDIQQIVDLVNAERTKIGLAPLTLDIQLSNAAQIRAQEQYTLFSHSRPNGSSYRTVLDENGISYMGCGENVAYGFRNPQAVMQGWMNSEGHKANILQEKFTHIGIGYRMLKVE